MDSCHLKINNDIKDDMYHKINSMPYSLRSKMKKEILCPIHKKIGRNVGEFAYRTLWFNINE